MFWRVLGLCIALGIVAFFLMQGSGTGQVDKGVANQMVGKAKELRENQNKELEDAMKGM